MSYRVTLSEHDGAPVACKTVLDGAAAATHRLAHEATNLSAVQHPGLVRLVDWDGTTLTTEFAGQPVRQIVAVPTPLAAEIVATLAHTVADLHAAGLVHGSIEPSHVLVGHGAHPQLCSLGSMACSTPEAEAHDVAGLGIILRNLIGDIGDGDPIPERRSMWPRPRARSHQYERRGLLTIADQATADTASHRPTARRLAQLITDTVPAAKAARLGGASIVLPDHLDPAAPQTEPGVTAPEATDDIGPDRLADLPFPHPALGGLIVPDTPAELFGLTPDAETPVEIHKASHPAAGRTSEPGLAWSPPDLTGDRPADEPAWPGDDDPSPTASPDDSPSRRRDLRPIISTASAVMGMALLAIGVLGLVRPTRESVVASAEAPATTISRIEPAVPTEPSTTTTHDKPAGPPEPTTVPPARPSCGPVGAPDLDDDGCGDQLDIEGTIVRVGDLRFQVGRPDDVVTLGDWDCDGVVTPALLRPSTGEVFVFSEWTESQLSVRPIERVPLARTIHPDEDGIGCHQLVVEDADGRRTTIDAR